MAIPTDDGGGEVIVVEHRSVVYQVLLDRGEVIQ